jgi:Flp pilus assembly protein TadG
MFPQQTKALWTRSEGNVGMLFAFMLVPLVALGGGGIDLARYEKARVELQDGLDRGVLAAASLTQSRGAEAVLQDYLKTLPYADDIELELTQQSAINSRMVVATATYSIDTAFIKLIGVDKLTISATSRAQEAKQNIEMSLMLDMSGSMAANNRIGNLKKAAKEFIDQMLTNDTKSYTTISIVPYAGQVNVGSAVFDKLEGKRIQSQSSCFELGETNGAYGADPMVFKGAAQVPHFTHWNFGKTNMRPWWCPLESTAITYFSNDATALKSKIDKLEMHDGTGTQNAMQWGYTLLNPAAKGLFVAAVATGNMDSKFSNRPAAFNDPDTMKVIVLMTDGEITEQVRPKDYNRPVTQQPDNKEISNRKTNATRLANVCNKAKVNGVTVFTIGFEVAGEATTQMRSCASSPGHYYPTSGAGISDAFKSISISIKKLRLTQ